MSPADFIKEYETALGTQDWTAVAPLICDDARVIFSDGSLHTGKDAIRAAYERNFATIKSEKFSIANVHWLLETSKSAAYMFDFHWAGVVEGQQTSGSGRGTTVLVRRADRWLLVAEQLGPKRSRG
ncbi:MAG: nuclear transport factor 2 family protein [Pseudomonadota bacterium]